MCPALINSVVYPHHIVITLSDLIINFVRNNILGTHTCLSDPFSFIFVTREAGFRIRIDLMRIRIRIRIQFFFKLRILLYGFKCWDPYHRLSYPDQDPALIYFLLREGSGSRFGSVQIIMDPHPDQDHWL
jgi:hypothetical protein